VRLLETIKRPSERRTIMSLISWLRTRTSARTPQAPKAQRLTSRRFRPRLEALEDRWLPSTLTVTNNLDSGTGSLRADIAAAKSGDTINFAPSLDGQTITLTSGELAITTGLTIQGPGASQLTVSGNNASRVFEVNSSQPVVLSGLTISNARGCGIKNDSGSALTVSACTIDHCSASVIGGGILNYGTLTVTGCTIAGNSVNSLRSGFGGGAGIDNFRGKLTVSNSTIAGNIDSGRYANGGGIFAGWGTTVALTDCTISNNKGGGGGGGVYADGGSTVTLTNCTLANNTANEGGGLFVNGGIPGYPGGGATVNVTNCTVSGNTAYVYGGGIYVNYTYTSGLLILSNTIVAGNSVPIGTGTAVDIYNNGVVWADHNLLGDVGGNTVIGTSDNIVIYNAKPLLGPLQNNGGPTQTMALLAGSPAIGHADNSKAPATDQRGFTRLDVAGELTDIGAFEL
jgi:predicted outer membrane repeat protein